MPISNPRQLVKGLVLFSGLLLLAACAGTQEPYAVVYEPEEVSEDNQVKAIIPEQPQPAETVVYEPEHPQTYIVQEGDTL